MKDTRTSQSRTTAFTVVELVVTVAIIGIMASVGLVLLPRHAMTVDQAQRIVGSSIQFTRFEAIKRNESIAVGMVAGTSELAVLGGGGTTVIRRYDLDPEGDRVLIKSATPSDTITFNARGVATAPVARMVTIGLAGRDDFDRVLRISGQGAVVEVP